MPQFQIVEHRTFQSDKNMLVEPPHIHNALSTPTKKYDLNLNQPHKYRKVRYWLVCSCNTCPEFSSQMFIQCMAFNELTPKTKKNRKWKSKNTIREIVTVRVDSVRAWCTHYLDAYFFYLIKDAKNIIFQYEYLWELRYLTVWRVIIFSHCHLGRAEEMWSIILATPFRGANCVCTVHFVLFSASPYRIPAFQFV